LKVFLQTQSAAGFFPDDFYFLNKHMDGRWMIEHGKLAKLKTSGPCRVFTSKNGDMLLVL